MFFLEVIPSASGVQDHLFSTSWLHAKHCKTKEISAQFTMDETLIKLVMILSEDDSTVFSVISSLVTSGIILRLFCSSQEKENAKCAARLKVYHINSQRDKE